MTIAEKLTYIQEFYKLSDSKLSRIAGVKKGVLATWKDGSVKPNEGDLKKLCKHFSFVPQYFIEDRVSLKPISKIESYEVVLDENVYKSRQRNAADESKTKINYIDEITPNEDNARYEEND